MDPNTPRQATPLEALDFLWKGTRRLPVPADEHDVYAQAARIVHGALQADAKPAAAPKKDPEPQPKPKDNVVPFKGKDKS